MINKQLETNVNNEKILERLAENLNIDFISNGSNLKKIADAYSSENINFSSNIDEAIANGFLSTMSSEFLELFGNQYNIYRKNYNNISVYSYQETALLEINKTEAMVSSFNQELKVFSKGSTIYSDDNILIESLSDIYVSDINSSQYISVKISLSNSLNQYVIQEESEFSVISNNSAVVSILPYFVLTFKRAVGLAVLQEFEEDYRLRLYEATYIANNGANSLVSTITKEVPYLYFIEVDDYTNGRGIKTIYPYTKELIDSGSDDYLDNLIIPLVETSLKDKILNGQLISVLKPEPLLLNSNIVFTNSYTISDTLLENVRTVFNSYFCTYKNISRQVLEDFIKNEIGVNSQYISSISFSFTSPYVSEETFTLDTTTDNVVLPKGRFLYLNTLTKE